MDHSAMQEVHSAKKSRFTMDSQPRYWKLSGNWTLYTSSTAMMIWKQVKSCLKTVMKFCSSTGVMRGPGAAPRISVFSL